MYRTAYVRALGHNRHHQSDHLYALISSLHAVDSKVSNGLALGHHGHIGIDVPTVLELGRPLPLSMQEPFRSEVHDRHAE